MQREYETLVEILKEWAKWMGGYNLKTGYPSRVPLLSTGGWTSSFDELLDKVDAEQMRLVDSSIESLVPSQKAAILRCYNICTVWRFPRDNYDQCLLDAHEILLDMLKRKDVIF